ncbi:DUF1761 domain-containing protein [Candidatus Saccharibacteria bacterium]|nr:DUF1761 domain-containing protein [Candidatus Saccharibacteria bacterium]
MLEFSGINYLAVAAVWLVYVAVGAWWYSPAGFAKQWNKYTGINILKMPQEEASRAIVAVAISAAVQAYTLAIVLNSLHVATIIDGLAAGLLIWLGLVTATTVGVTLYSRRSWDFLWLNSAYFLVVMSVGSVILAAWQ